MPPNRLGRVKIKVMLLLFGPFPVKQRLILEIQVQGFNSHLVHSQSGSKRFMMSWIDQPCSQYQADSFVS